MGTHHSTVAQLIAQVESNDPTLTKIDFYSLLGEGEKMSTADFTRLCTALRTNTHVVAATLAGRRVTNSNEAVVPLADMLRVNRSITLLTLGGWLLHTRNAELLAPGLWQHPTLRSLTLNGDTHTDLRLILTALIDCPALETLRFTFSVTVSNAVAELAALVRRSSSLTDLQLGSCNFNGRPLQLLLNELQTNARLSSLSLYLNNLTNDDAVHIASMLRVNRSLQMLELSFNRNIGSAGWRAIADAVNSNTTLTFLGTDLCNIPAVIQQRIDAVLKSNAQAAELARIPAPASVADQRESHVTQPGVPVPPSSSPSAHAAAASASSSQNARDDDLSITQPAIAAGDSSGADPAVTLPQSADPAALTLPVEYTQPGVPSEADMRTESAVPLQSESLNDEDDSVTLPAVPAAEQLAAMLATHAAISVASPAAAAVSPPAFTSAAAAAAPTANTSHISTSSPTSASAHISDVSPSPASVTGLSSWDTAAVFAWLTSLGPAYSSYATAWERDGITGGYLSRLRSLPTERREAKLRDLLGVASPLHRDVILDALDAM